MKKYLSTLLILTIYTNCYAQSSSFLNSNKLGKAPYQASTQTCVGWSLIYGMLSYHHNNLTNDKPLSYFNPCYNFQSKCDKNGYICDILKSINNDGLLKTPPLFTCQCTIKPIQAININKTYNSNLIAIRLFNGESRPLNLDELKQEISLKKHGFVLCYAAKYNENNDTLLGDYYVQTLKRPSIGDNQPYLHAIFCIGYDDKKAMLNGSKGGFLFRDSDWRGKHKGEIWIAYDDLKKGLVNQIFFFNDEREGIKFDRTKDKICSHYKNYGSVKNRLWWLGKPAFSLKRRKKIYYFTNHMGFKVSLLKLHIMGNKASIGILNNDNKRLYSFNIKPNQSVVFSVDSVNYKFYYAKKTFKNGVNFYPEINYTIEPYECSSIPFN